METSEALIMVSLQRYYNHSAAILSGNARQSGAQRPAFRLLQCLGTLAITFHVSCYKLDFEEHHQGNKEWNLVDPLVTAGGLHQ